MGSPLAYDHAMYQAKRNGKNRYHFFELESVASLA